MPTEYRGVSELGAIAGTGMIVAFTATITLLPALLVVLRPPGARAAAGYVALAPLDRFLVERRRFVLAIAGIVVVGSLARRPRLQFDFNPLHLRSAKVESVATLLDLVRDSTAAPNSIDVLAPSLAGAAALAERLAQLAEIDHAVTLASFVPDGQDEKLALIRDAVLLEPALNPGQTAPQPSDAEDVRAMERATRSLERAAVDHSGEVACARSDALRASAADAGAG